MSAQLFQLLGQLDRPGASELVIATGRQVAIRVNSTYQTLTASPVTLPQLLHLIRDTELAGLVPTSEQVGEPVALALDGRALRAQFIRQGADVMLRLEPRPAAPARPSPAPAPRTAAIPTPARPAPTPTPEGLTLAPQRSTPIPTIGPVPAEPRDPTRGGVNPTALPSESGREGPLLLDEPIEIVPALASLVSEARRRNATDLHISANRPVVIRAVAELVPLDPAPVAAADIDRLLLPLLGPGRRAQLAARGYVDLAIDVPGAGRLRTNISRQQGGLKGAFRLAVARPPTLAELGLPAAVAKVTENHQGLVVIAGPSGHGKTTTLAALVDLLNRADPIHILTIEDPVEIIHPKHVAVVSQREVGRHTVSFAAALKASLREDPDVIVIGELRDRETVEIALTAAETGHLVLATMSTPSAAKTIDRLVDMFPPDDQAQVRASLGAALKAIVAQRLLPNAQGDGVVAAVELLVGSLALSNMIRDNKLFQLPNLMQRGKAFGMIRLDDSLAELARAGKLAEDVALRNADNKKDMHTLFHPPPPPAEPAKRGLFGKKEGA
ncbi:MAG TPA: PilT/PilU family type 4a pilus ATPase [Kofleriaceae bacterium]|nr:PilT/PilU family type 4a pilus ATPase [Kofleriaceae bacterium]